MKKLLLSLPVAIAMSPIAFAVGCNASEDTNHSVGNGTGQKLNKKDYFSENNVPILASFEQIASKAEYTHLSQLVEEMKKLGNIGTNADNERDLAVEAYKNYSPHYETQPLSFPERQQMLEAQRRNGITGGAAQGQLSGHSVYVDNRASLYQQMINAQSKSRDAQNNFLGKLAEYRTYARNIFDNANK